MDKYDDLGMLVGRITRSPKLFYGVLGVTAVSIVMLAYLNIRNNDCSEQPSVSQATSEQVAPIYRPTGLSAISVCNPDSSGENKSVSVTFKWLPGPADHYRVFVEGAPMWNEGEIVPQTDCNQLCEYTHNALPPNKSLAFIVSAYQNKEEVPKSGSPSDVAFFSTPSCALKGN